MHRKTTITVLVIQETKQLNYFVKVGINALPSINPKIVVEIKRFSKKGSSDDINIMLLEIAKAVTRYAKQNKIQIDNLEILKSKEI